MAEAPIKNIKIHITSRFIDSRSSRSYAPGVWDVDMATARRLHTQGKGRVMDKKLAAQLDAAVVASGGTVAEIADEGIKTEPDKTPTGSQTSEEGGQGGSQEPQDPLENVDPNATVLPEGFPERDKLIEAGFPTVQSLREKGADNELSKRDFSKAQLNKIGMALNELK